MPSGCFVPGCKTMNGRNRLIEGENEPRKLGMFRPQNAEMLVKWEQAIGRNDKTLSMRHLVCELHFKKTEVLSSFSVPIKDGAVFTLERQVKKLQKDAVPMFIAETFFKQEESELSGEILHPLFPLVGKILRPSRYWCPEQVIDRKLYFVHISKELKESDKIVNFHVDKTVEVYIRGKKIDHPDVTNLSSLSKSDIENILIKVDKITPCNGSDNLEKNENCIGFVVGATKCCKNCTEHKRIIRRRTEALNQLLQTRKKLRNETKKNRRLKLKAVKLFSRLKLMRQMCAEKHTLKHVIVKSL